MGAITLLRHGETTRAGCYIGRSDPPLSALGEAQMQTAVADRTWMRIVSSPRRRCADFAQRLAAARGVPLQIDARLAELDFGDWDGVPVAELHAHSPAALAAFWRDPLAHPPPRGETLTALRARVLAALADRADEPGPTLLVTHGGPLRVALAERDGLPLAQLMTIDVAHGACHRFSLRRVAGVATRAAPPDAGTAVVVVVARARSAVR